MTNKFLFLKETNHWLLEPEVLVERSIMVVEAVQNFAKRNFVWQQRYNDTARFQRDDEAAKTSSRCRLYMEKQETSWWDK